MEKLFKDKNGQSRVVMEGSEAPLNVETISRAVLANRPKTENKKVQLDNIGPGSNGFAGVALLAGIIALAGVLIAYFSLKY